MKKRTRKKLELRNIIIFCICCFGWMITVFKINAVSEGIGLILLPILSTIGIWQLNLSEGKNNAAILSFF